jgi:thiol-disulfide isomerase/thioredoxin
MPRPRQEALCVRADRLAPQLARLLLVGAAACKGGSAEPAAPDAANVSAAAAPPASRVRMAAAAPAGKVSSIVRDALANAAAQGRKLVVYVGASWCEPCERFHEAAVRGELDGVLGDLEFLEFDLDRDDQRLRESGYASRYVPLFALPKTDGTASGRQIEGVVKGEGAVAFIVPRLQKLLSE